MDKQLAQRVTDVLAGFPARTPLAHCARLLDHARHDPAVLDLLEGDRPGDRERARHTANRTSPTAKCQRLLTRGERPTPSTVAAEDVGGMVVPGPGRGSRRSDFDTGIADCGRSLRSATRHPTAAGGEPKANGRPLSEAEPHDILSAYGRYGGTQDLAVRMSSLRATSQRNALRRGVLARI